MKVAGVLTGICVLLALAGTSLGADANWTGTTSNVWQLNTNWSASPYPATGNTATFNAAGNGNTTIDLGTGLTVKKITFSTASAAAYTIGSGAAGSQSFTLNDTGVVTLSSGVVNSEAFNANVLLGTATAGTYTFTNASTTGQTLTFAGNIEGGTGGTAAAKTLTINGSGNTTVSGIIANGGATSVALFKDNAGTLTLSNANTYTGTTTISAGTLALSGSGTLGGGAAALTLSGGALDLGTLSRTVGAVSITAAAASGGTIFNGSLGGTSYAVSNASGNVIVSANLLANGAAGLTKTGAGTLTLSGANTYAGLTTVSGGVLNIQNDTATGTTAAGVSVASGTALQMQGGITVGAEALTLSGTGIGATGALRNISGNNVWQGAVTLGAATRINSDAGSLTFNTAATSITAVNVVLALGGAGDGTIGGAITTGTGELAKDGAGMWTLSGANTYTGTTTINAGVLRANDAAGLPTVSLLTINSGVFETGVNLARLAGNSAGRMQITGGTSGFSAYGGPVQVAFGTLATPTPLTWGTAQFNPATALVLNGTTANNTLDFKNAINFGASARLVNVNAGAAYAATMSGVLSGAGGGITKGGAGTLILTNANTYTGATTINLGALLINGVQTAATGAVMVNSGGTLGGTGTVGGAVTVASGGKLSPGASIGVLTVNNSLDISGALGGPAGSQLFELGPSSGDKVTLTGANVLTIGSGLLNWDDFVFSGTPTTGTYTLFDTGAAISGSLGASLAGAVGGLNGTLGLANSNQDIVLTLLAPTPAITGSPATGAIIDLGTVMQGNVLTTGLTDLAVTNTGEVGSTLHLNGFSGLTGGFGLAGGNATASIAQGSPGEPFAFNFDAITATLGEHQTVITLASTDGGSLSYTLTANVIPEPATMSLLALGGLAALLRRRRK